MLIKWVYREREHQVYLLFYYIHYTYTYIHTYPINNIIQLQIVPYLIHTTVTYLFKPWMIVVFNLNKHRPTLSETRRQTQRELCPNNNITLICYCVCVCVFRVLHAAHYTQNTMQCYRKCNNKCTSVQTQRAHINHWGVNITFYIMLCVCGVCAYLCGISAQHGT